MRPLTEAEARVIATLLAARPDRERERLRQAGIPRSTYYTVRRRAYAEGWLHDRYVPDPSRVGYPYATFLVARPFLDRYADFVNARPAGAVTEVVLWASPQVSLAVLFHQVRAAGAQEVTRWEHERLLASATRVTVPLAAPSVPVYFDFEGLWDHLAGLEGTSAYPHGLGGSRPDGVGDALSGPPLTSHTRWAFAHLLERPIVAAERGEDGHLLGAFGLPYSERRLFSNGWVTHRVFLEPSRLPPYMGRAADRIHFISGTPRAGARPERLFETLTAKCRVFPFLYVVGEERWLFGALGGSSPESGPSPAAPHRRPVLGALREAMEDIEIVQDASENFSMAIDHRYDLLVPNQ
ncbi:MAG: hypothetical protein WAN74_04515 [Thermoplasmata archaeon]